MDLYERMTQVLDTMEPDCPEEGRPLIEAVRQSVHHPNSSLVSLVLFVVRYKAKLGELTVKLVYLIKALEAVRNHQFDQAHQFLLAADKDRSGSVWQVTPDRS